MGSADLHIHSTASDGKLSPGQVVKLAAEKRLEVISLTDHDTIAGLAEAINTGRKHDVRVLPGVEVTSIFRERETHLLGYCFEVDDSGLVSLLTEHRQARVKRIEWIIGELNNKGLDLDVDEVKAEARGGNVGRPHVAAVLIRKGYVGSAREAFYRYLGDRVLGPIESSYVSCREAMQVVKSAGGAVVLAHPGVLYTKNELDELTEMGIDGIEVIHPSHNYELQKKYEDYASDHNLLVTGGSDYHGIDKNYTGRFGEVTISKSWVHKLTRMTDRRKQISVNSK